MEIGQNRFTKNYYSILIDYEKYLVHRFNLSNQFVSPYQFYYEWSNKMIEDYHPIKYNELIIEKLSHLKYKITTNKSKRSKKNRLEIILELEPFQDDLILVNFEPLTKTQMNEIEGLIKRTLKSDAESGHFYIKKITYKYFKNSILNKKIKPERINVSLDLSKL